MICCRSESGGLLENLTIRQEEKKMEVVKIMNKKILAAALTATMVGSMFSTVAGAEEAKNIPELDHRADGDYVLGYVDRGSAEGQFVERCR